ncbi:hypothetical protein HUU39_02050 [candidate division KSB1 bacterium]|nr:hypothetical protein [candidate division KSB1 bacterium]
MNKIRTCLQESPETRCWLIVSKFALGESELNTWLRKEVSELIKIFNSIIAKTIKRRKSPNHNAHKSRT